MADMLVTTPTDGSPASLAATPAATQPHITFQRDSPALVRSTGLQRQACMPWMTML